MSSPVEIVEDPHEKDSEKWFAKAFGTLKYYADEHAAASVSTAMLRPGLPDALS